MAKGCFLCWNPLEDPAIHWMGSTGDIYLHPACVIELAIRMFRDVHEVECTMGLRMEAKARDVP